MRTAGKSSSFCLYVRLFSLFILTALALANFSRLASFTTSFTANQAGDPIKFYLDQTIPPTLELSRTVLDQAEASHDTLASHLNKAHRDIRPVVKDRVEVHPSDGAVETVDQDQNRPSWARAERVAVIVKRNNSRAPVLSIPIEFLPEDLVTLRESRRWLTWLVSHFDHLPEYVAFVHDHGKTYHTLRERIDLLEQAKPESVLMISKKSWKMAGIARDTFQKRWPRSMDIREKKKLDWVYQFLFAIDFGEAWYKWNMPEYKCCAEMVVSRAAVHRVGLSKLRAILREVEGSMEEPWAWVMERTWENLFKYG